MSVVLWKPLSRCGERQPIDKRHFWLHWTVQFHIAVERSAILLLRLYRLSAFRLFSIQRSFPSCGEEIVFSFGVFLLPLKVISVGKMARNQMHLFVILSVLLGKVLSDPCLLYLAPSTISETGRGLFAGVPLDGNLTFAEDTSIVLHEAHSYMGSLHNYVHAIADSDRVALHLGATNFINSAPQGTARRAWILDDSPPHSMSLPYSDFYPRATYSTQDIPSGQEILTYYGPTWFQHRHIDERHASTEETAVTVATLENVGVCLTDAYVSGSTIPGAHLGLFAHRSFSADELVTVSPVALLRMKNVYVTQRTSTLINYVITEPGSTVGVLPLGNVAMMNHGHGDEANVYLAWFDWTGKARSASTDKSKDSTYVEKCISKGTDLEQLLQEPVSGLLARPFAPLDLALYAKRPIAAGEELFIDYGPTWTSFVERCIDPATKRLNPEYECLHFRHAIEVATGLFPSHWHREEEETPTPVAPPPATAEGTANKNSNNNKLNDSEQKSKKEGEGLGNRFSSMFNNLFGRK